MTRRAAAPTTGRVLSSSTLTGESVVNAKGEDLGNIEEIMLDTESGRVAYAVLSFGGFLGLGDKYFAIPWSAFQPDPEHERLVLDVPKDTLKEAEGFDKNDWPDFADRRWEERVHRHYSAPVYW